MKVNLSADMQAKLARIARERGMESQTLAQEVIEQLVNSDGAERHGSRTNSSTGDLPSVR